jgi:hypothetical protein
MIKLNNKIRQNSKNLRACFKLFSMNGPDLNSILISYRSIHMAVRSDRGRSLVTPLNLAGLTTRGTPMQSVSINEATVHAVVELLANLSANDPDGDRFAMKLDQYKAKALGGEHKKAATDFSFDDIITIFKLKYNSEPSLTSLHESHWAIENELQSTFPMTPCLSCHFLSLSCVMSN